MTDLNINAILVLLVIAAASAGALIWYSPDAAWRLSRKLRARSLACRAARTAYAECWMEAMADIDSRVMAEITERVEEPAAAAVVR